MILFRQPLFLLCILVGLPQLSETIYTPFLPILEDYFKTTANLMQFTLSIYFLGFAFGVFLFGVLCDKIGRKKSLYLGLLLYSISTFSLSLTQNIYIFLCIRFFQAMGASVGSVVIQTILRDSFIEKARLIAFAKISLVMAVAPGLGPILGSLLEKLHGINLNFWFLSLLGLILLLFSKKMILETKPKNQNHISIFELLKTMFKDKRVLLSALIIAIHNTIIFGFLAEGPFVLKADHGFLGLNLSIAIFCGSFLNKKYIKNHSPITLHKIGSYIMIFSSLSMLVLLLLFGANSIYFSMGLLVIGMSLSLSNILSIALKDYAYAQGKASAVFGLFYYIILSSLLGLFSLLHNNSPLTMPIFFISLTFLLSKIKY